MVGPTSQSEGQASARLADQLVRHKDNREIKCSNVVLGKCQTSNLRVVKTIRLRKENLESWIGSSDIQARIRKE